MFYFEICASRNGKIAKQLRIEGFRRIKDEV
jgi:hypothetical protein